MKRIAPYLVALVALAFVAGCGVSEKSLIGKWTGKIEMSEEDKKAAGVAADMTSQMKFDLELKEDKTFVLSMMGFPSEGTWVFTDGKVTLTTTKVMGMDVPADSTTQKPQSLNVEDGGKTLTMSDPDAKSASKVTFTRAEA